MARVENNNMVYSVLDYDGVNVTIDNGADTLSVEVNYFLENYIFM